MGATLFWCLVAKGEVGIGAICLTNSMMVLCQFSDSTAYHMTLTKLLSINPAKIIIPCRTSGMELYHDSPATCR